MIFKFDPAALFDFKALIKLVKPPLTIYVGIHIIWALGSYLLMGATYTNPRALCMPMCFLMNLFNFILCIYLLGGGASVPYAKMQHPPPPTHTHISARE